MTSLDRHLADWYLYALGLGYGEMEALRLVQDMLAKQIIDEILAERPSIQAEQ